MDLKPLSNKIHALVKQFDEQKSGLLLIFCGSRGFPPRMSPAEMLTFMIYFHFSRFTDFKAFCQYMRQHHAETFPRLLHYKTLCAWRTRSLDICKAIMHMLMQEATDTEEKFIDSTHLDICHPIRADEQPNRTVCSQKRKKQDGVASWL